MIYLDIKYLVISSLVFYLTATVCRAKQWSSNGGWREFRTLRHLSHLQTVYTRDLFTEGIGK